MRTPTSDLRQGGSWTPLQRAKNDALWAIACVTLAATRPLPLPALRFLGRVLGAAGLVLAPGARRTALANVALVFPHLGQAERLAFVSRCFATLGECLGETIALLHPGRTSPTLPLAEQARTLLAETRAEGQGIVFASAHLGPWERVAAALVRAGVPLVTLARESYDPRFTRIYDKLRSAHGVRVVWRAEPGAAARIVRTLRGGGVLGVPMDLCARVASCRAPFLGHDAPTAIGPARIALRTRAALIVGTVAPGRRRNEMVITASRIAMSGLLPGADGVAELTSRINKELSHRILALPHAWVWMHERWPTQTLV